jgi:hypothetical protein
MPDELKNAFLPDSQPTDRQTGRCRGRLQNRHLTQGPREPGRRACPRQCFLIQKARPRPCLQKSRPIPSALMQLGERGGVGEQGVGGVQEEEGGEGRG